MNLLSENDKKTIAAALRSCREITLERTFGSRTVIAQTMPVSAPWDVPMIVQIRVNKPGYSWLQNFKSAEDAVRAANDDN